MLTVIGGAALDTVESALRVAQAMGKEMLMELTGIRDILAWAEGWCEIGVERMVYHRGEGLQPRALLPRHLRDRRRPLPPRTVG